MLWLALLCGIVTQPAASVPIDQAEENAILSVVLRDPWLRMFGPQYVVVERKTSISVFTPWLAEKQTAFAYQRDGSEDWAHAPVELLESARQRNRRSVSIDLSALPPDGRWCRGTGESLRSCIVVSRPGVTSDGLKAAVAVLSPNLSGWTSYLEKRDGSWQVVGRGFLYAAG
jgi:hypothetical protein